MIADLTWLARGTHQDAPERSVGAAFEGLDGLRHCRGHLEASRSLERGRLVISCLGACRRRRGAQRCPVC